MKHSPGDTVYVWQQITPSIYQINELVVEKVIPMGYGGYDLWYNGLGYWKWWDDKNTFSSIEEALRYGIERPHMVVHHDKGRYVIDLIQKVATLKPGQWWEWSCDVSLEGGPIRSATIQSDGQSVAIETLEYD